MFEKGVFMNESVNLVKGQSVKIKNPGKLGFDWKKAKKMKILYLLLFIPVAWVFIFGYIPMYGVVIAFKDYRMCDGILGSSWNQFENFKLFFSNPSFFRVLKNTILLNIYGLIFGFPAPIVLAILLNEIRNVKFKKTVQTISYLPHFLSWVILAVMITEVLSPKTGIINYIISLFGVEPIYFLANKSFFRPILIITGIWQSIGWGSIVYLASLTGIDPGLYQAAEIDGATRFQRIIYITIPSLLPVITFFAIIHMGKMLKCNFEQVYNLLNPMVYGVGEVIDTYVFRVGLVDDINYSYAAAVGLFVNVVGIILLIISNKIAKKFSEYALW